MEETCSECAFDESLAQPKDVALALPPLATAIGDDIRANPQSSTGAGCRRTCGLRWNTLGTFANRWPSIAGSSKAHSPKIIR